MNETAHGRIVSALTTLDREMSAKPRVSDHAVVRYLERKYNFSFEDIREERFVDLSKTINMECTFNYKFKRWVPVRVIHGQCRIVNIGQLAK